VEPALEKILNLLLESERAGVAALDALAGQVKSEELKRLLMTSREDENETVRALEQLIRNNGGTPSDKTRPFAARIAAAGNLREQLNLLIRGEEWVARKVEEALGVASPSGPINQYLRNMARRHRFEVEWGRAELLRLINELVL
jgi:Domain of unknown function (DUF6306)